MSSNKRSSAGTNLSTAVQIVLIALKLTGVISWSWFWVLSPLWVGVIVAVLLIVGALIYRNTQ